MRRPTLCTPFAALVAMLALPAVARADVRTLEEYRYFRALSIDLTGRIPTTAEVAQFEQEDFDVEAWIDARLTQPAYADRMTRLYNDRLRLEMQESTGLRSTPVEMRRVEVLDAAGHRTWVYYRPGQRRTDVDTDGAFCFTPAETGVQLPNGTSTPVPGCDSPRRVSAALMNERTVAVHPWWLYADYRSASPSHPFDAASWAASHPGFVPAAGLRTDPDGTPIGAMPTVRVCREEAQNNATGSVYAPGPRVRHITSGCGMQRIGIPRDSAYATAHEGGAVSCATGLGLASSPQCGCGAGLERCLPGTNNALASASFIAPARASMGNDLQLDAATITAEAFIHRAWTQEAIHFIADVFGRDRDVRDLVRARDTFVNGPLAQFYRTTATIDCCGAAANAPGNMVTPTQSLFAPSSVPAAILPNDTGSWTHVPDRGALAAGIITMPIFLSKYGTRRARAHALYNAFLCKDFVAGNLMLSADNNPDLTRRNGCAVCHAALEPLSAYFTRIQESTWLYLSRDHFPLHQPQCSLAGAAGTMETACGLFYDPNFANHSYGRMLGSYASEANAEAGAPGIASYLVARNEFAPCVVQNIAESFLGRSLDADDAELQRTLTTALTGGGYRTRAVVRTLLLSDAYRHANDLASSEWRSTHGEH